MGGNTDLLIKWIITMKWIISHQSALEFWRKTPAEDSLAGKKSRAMKPQAKPLNAEELHAESFRGLAMPIHVLVGSGNARKVNRTLHCHVSSGEFPNGSFVRMDSGLIVSSPELCFLQMASELSLTDLVALGCELCGNYRLDGGGAKGKGFREDLPLTSVGSLSSFTTKATGLKGCKNARKALRFIADGSASPMETILTILLVFPYRLGGFGFPKPLLNYRIEAPASAKNPTSKSKHYYCDLYWPDKKVDVEYDSDAYHTGPDRIAQDAIRRNALSSMDIIVVTVSRKQVVDALEMRDLAEILSKHLGWRLNYLIKEFADRQKELLDQLLPELPLSSYL